MQRISKAPNRSPINTATSPDVITRSHFRKLLATIPAVSSAPVRAPSASCKAVANPRQTNYRGKRSWQLARQGRLPKAHLIPPHALKAHHRRRAWSRHSSPKTSPGCLETSVSSTSSLPNAVPRRRPEPVELTCLRSRLRSRVAQFHSTRLLEGACCLCIVVWGSG